MGRGNEPAGICEYPLRAGYSEFKYVGDGTGGGFLDYEIGKKYRYILSIRVQEKVDDKMCLHFR